MKEVKHSDSDKVTIYEDFFDEALREEIYNECQKHFEPSNLNSDDSRQVTNCIIDCHGLNLSKTRFFPYDVNCWNIFCLKVKENVVKYAERFGCDSTDIIPFTCWGERFSPECSNYVSSPTAEYDDLFNESKSPVQFRYDRAIPTTDREGQVKKHFIHSTYTLYTTSPSVGIIAYLDDRVIETLYSNRSIPTHFDTPQNSMVIFDGSYKHTVLFPTNNHHIKYTINFSWYINKPFEVPDWILP
tara:strand:+ start:1717 stop:2445 length:729 start_codon:yes stop_codon:yes gene_type:complete